MEAIAEAVQLERYPAYKDSGAVWLGEIPKHWELTRLGTRFEERRTKVSDKDFPPLSVTKQGILPQLDSAAKSNDGDNRKLVKAGDFVINSRSDRKGSSGIATTDGSVSLINIVIEPKNIYPTFCNYLLKSYAFVEEYYRMGHGIVADLWTTRYDEMKAIILGIPPEGEQKAIAHFLDHKTAQIEKAIGIKEKQIELLKERRQVLIHKAVTRGLNPNAPMKDSGVDWIGEIPAHWIIEKGKWLFEKKSRPVRPQDGVVTAFRDGQVTLRSNRREEGYTFAIQEHGYQGIRKGDLVIHAMDAFAGAIGVSDSDGKSSPVYAACAPKDGMDLNPHFYAYLLRNLAITGFIESLAKGIRERSTDFRFKDFGNLPLSVPPFDEQNEIVGYLDKKLKDIDISVQHIKKLIEKLKEYKATLINSAVTGKVKVC